MNPHPRPAPHQHCARSRYAPAARLAWAILGSAVLATGGVAFERQADATTGTDDVPRAHPIRQLLEVVDAEAYNDDLTPAVALVPGMAQPVSDTFTPGGPQRYADMLDHGLRGHIAHIRIPAIGLSEPISRDSGRDVEAGLIAHVEGSSLPVGGTDTRAVFTVPDSFLGIELDDVIEVTTGGRELTYLAAGAGQIPRTELASLQAVPGFDTITFVIPQEEYWRVLTAIRVSAGGNR